MTEDTPEIHDEIPTPPAPLIAGTFAVYDDNKGGFVLVAQQHGGEITRKHIPASVVKMASGSGLFGRKFSAMLGG